MGKDRYVPRTLAEVAGLLEGMGFHRTDLPGVGEVVYDRPVVTNQLDPRTGKKVGELDLGITIRVFTSVSRIDDGSRACGKDAGRVDLVYFDPEGRCRLVWSGKKVLRTKSFLENLRERCRDAWRAACSAPSCPECGAPMVARCRRGEDEPSFNGCARFPECKGTRPL